MSEVYQSTFGLSLPASLCQLHLVSASRVAFAKGWDGMGWMEFDIQQCILTIYTSRLSSAGDGRSVMWQAACWLIGNLLFHLRQEGLNSGNGYIMGYFWVIDLRLGCLFWVNDIARLPPSAKQPPSIMQHEALPLFAASTATTLSLLLPKCLSPASYLAIATNASTVFNHHRP